MTHTAQTPETLPRPAAVFDRILVDIDGTTHGFDACRQAALLATADSELAAASVVQLAPLHEDIRERAAQERLAAAKEILGPRCRTQRLYGLVVDQLLAEAERLDATLLAIGSPQHRRIEEIILGGVAGELLHRAPCSILVARPAPDLATFPHSIVVGIDGSEEAERAFAVAQLLAGRRHGTLQGLVAYGDKEVDADEIVHRHPSIETSEETAVTALVEASSSADLVVVGSRGLHGLRALGSVSERVAHQARCSVLVVRVANES
jgi:nucleotide-binding universal stress UspA family protein